MSVEGERGQRQSNALTYPIFMKTVGTSLGLTRSTSKLLRRYLCSKENGPSSFTDAPFPSPVPSSTSSLTPQPIYPRRPSTSFGEPGRRERPSPGRVTTPDVGDPCQSTGPVVVEFSVWHTRVVSFGVEDGPISVYKW